MNWAWATSLDQLWRSPAFPMWLTLAAAGFFGIIVLVTLLRAEKSVANGALTVITLLAVGIAVAATIRGFGPGGQEPVAGRARIPENGVGPEAFAHRGEHKLDLARPVGTRLQRLAEAFEDVPGGFDGG